MYPWWLSIGISLGCSDPGMDRPLTERMVSVPETVATAPPPVPLAPVPLPDPDPPLPPPDPYPLHGIVTHFLAQVFALPTRGSPVIGYARRGARLRASERLHRHGCSGGWHEVPGPGFVCAGVGYLMASTPPNFEPAPIAPSLTTDLPYAYAYTTRDDVVQYWRLPTLEEEEEALAAILRTRVATKDTTPLQARDGGADIGPDSEPVAETPSPEESPETAVEAPEPPGIEPVVEPIVAGEPSTHDLPDPVRLAMLQGFYIAIDREESTELGRRFYRTVRGGYVRSTEVVANIPPTSRGVVMGAEWQLPLGIVFRTGAHRFEQTLAERLVDVGLIERHTALPITAELTRNGQRYFVGHDETIVRQGAVRTLRAIARPGRVGPTDRWIHVNLTEQSLVAFEGDTPVFATLVSTGREGFETPTGLFRIESKHISITMDDDTNPDEAYSIEEVPWTLYFNGNFALHGAFWHYTFGRTRSHGCVNLAPADARWLFQWTGPALPPGWHGVFSTRDTRGTWVYVDS